jgi:hypothetical protein
MRLFLALLVATFVPAQSAVQQDETDFLALAQSIHTFRRGTPVKPFPASRHRSMMNRASPAFRQLLQAELDAHDAWSRHVELVNLARDCALRIMQRRGFCEIDDWAVRTQTAHFDLSDAFTRVAAAELRVPGRRRIAAQFPCIAPHQRLVALSYQNEVDLHNGVRPDRSALAAEMFELAGEVAACHGLDPEIAARIANRGKRQ